MKTIEIYGENYIEQYTKLGKLVANRELPILHCAKEIMDEYNL